jgi:hypothetical protein
MSPVLHLLFFFSGYFRRKAWGAQFLYQQLPKLPPQSFVPWSAINLSLYENKALAFNGGYSDIWHLNC